METVVIRKSEPLDLVFCSITLVHNCIFSILFWIKFENKSTFSDGFIWLEFQWKIWDNDVILGNREIMNHSHACDFDIHLIKHFTISIEQSVVYIWLFHVISKSKELSSNSTNFWVSRNVVFKLTIKIVTAN
jgi:hypothetical protein